jgi:hypothetical protein
MRSLAPGLLSITTATAQVGLHAHAQVRGQRVGVLPAG